MCGSDVGASLSSHTKLKATANTKKTAYAGQDAGTSHAADARDSATPAAATLARIAVVRLFGASRAGAGRSIAFVRALLPIRRRQAERAQLLPQRGPGDAEALRRLLPPVAVLAETAL